MCNDWSKLETVASLRKETEHELKGVKQTIHDNQQIDKQDKEAIEKRRQELSDRLDALNKAQNDFKSFI